jgi:translation initiation factor eIF-2B subunit gamma
VLSPNSNVEKQNLARQHSTLHVNGQTHETRLNGRFSEDIHTARSSPVHTARSSPVEQDSDEADDASFRVGVVIHRVSEGYAGRANNLQSYLDLNRHVRPFDSFRLESISNNLSLNLE